MFSTVGSWISKGVDAVAEKVGADMKLDDQYNDEDEAKEQKQRELEEKKKKRGSATTTPGVEERKNEDIDPTIVDDTTDHTDAGVDATGADLPVWEEPPTALVPHRDAWRTLVLGLMQDENTFIVSQKRLMEEKEGASWTTVLNILESQQRQSTTLPEATLLEKIADARLNADMEVKVTRIQEMLVANQLPDLNKLRYKISPHLVSDSQFWDNFRFRLCVLHQCVTLEALINLLEPLNTEPNHSLMASGQRKRNVGTNDNAAVLQQIRDAVNAKTILQDWVSKKKATSLDFLQAGRNSCTMLRSLLDQKEGAETELLESVAESCKYHKSKVGGLIGELAAPGTAEKLQGSGLESEGSIMEQLLKLNEDLHQELEAFVTRTPPRRGGGNASKKHAGGASTSVSQGSTGISPIPASPRDEDETKMKRAESTTSAAAAAIGGPDTPTTSNGSPTAAAGTGAAGTGSDNAFNASLPWDDDD